MTWLALAVAVAGAEELPADAVRVLRAFDVAGPPPTGPWPCAPRDAKAMFVDLYQPERGPVRLVQAFLVCGESAESWHRFKVVYSQKDGRPPRKFDWRLDDGGPFGTQALQDLEFCLDAVRWTTPSPNRYSYKDPDGWMVIRGPDPAIVVVNSRETPVSDGTLALFEFLMAFDDHQRDPVAMLAARRAKLETRPSTP